MSKTQKVFRLSDEIISKIKQIKEELSLSSDTAVIEYLVNNFYINDFADQIIDRLFERDRKYRERLRWATRTAEINSQMLLDAVNTILVSKKFEYCCFPEAYMSPVLEQSKENIERKIEHFKQEKDNRERKNNL